MLVVYSNFIRRVERATATAEDYFYHCAYQDAMEDFFQQTEEELEDIRFQAEEENRLRAKERAKVLEYIALCKHDLLLSFQELYGYAM